MQQGFSLFASAFELSRADSVLFHVANKYPNAKQQILHDSRFAKAPRCLDFLILEMLLALVFLFLSCTKVDYNENLCSAYVYNRCLPLLFIYAAKR